MSVILLCQTVVAQRLRTVDGPVQTTQDHHTHGVSHRVCHDVPEKCGHVLLLVKVTRSIPHVLQLGDQVIDEPDLSQDAELRVRLVDSLSHEKAAARVVDLAARATDLIDAAIDLVAAVREVLLESRGGDRTDQRPLPPAATSVSRLRRHSAGPQTIRSVLPSCPLGAVDSHLHPTTTHHRCS